MSFAEEIDQQLRSLNHVNRDQQTWLERFSAEIEFAGRLAAARPAEQADWEALIVRAAALVRDSLAGGMPPQEAVTAAEAVLAPLSEAAKQYTVHCVAHAHIDMNWMWGWPETAAAVNDTCLTMDRLMDEFPEFHFSQSQAEIYRILQAYNPALFARVKARVQEGRWEVTASQWVEGDKNMASGESLCRHLLYTKRFLQQELGLPYDAIAIDWEPDTFGHAHTVPTILRQAGVRRYYCCRPGKRPFLFWWQGPDGARVLVFEDSRQWYLGPLNTEVAKKIFEFEQATGLRDYLYAYGVGDHGGGPTRRDLRMARTMNSWPIFPQVRLSTTADFFAVAERDARDLPVIDDGINYVFHGCYTSVSAVKRANRLSENALVEAETAALLGARLAGVAYPHEQFTTAWRRALVNQFHDILPGSGVPATYQYSLGQLQEIIASTSMAKTSALRAMAGKVNTAAVCADDNSAADEANDTGLGMGAGDVPRDGAVSRRGAGGQGGDAFVVMNPTPWTRSELVTVRLWDRDYAKEQIVVRDDAGHTFPAQFIAREKFFWINEYIEVAFPATDVPALGYRSYCVTRAADGPAADAGCSGDGFRTIENEYFRVVVEPTSGGIVHLIDKRNGFDLVPPGERLGVLEYTLEAPNEMSAWKYGPVAKTVPFIEGAILESVQRGPYLASLRVKHKYNESTFTLTISLAANTPRIDFSLETDWWERGQRELGVPGLRMLFPLAVENGTTTFECPNGSETLTAPYSVNTSQPDAGEEAPVPENLPMQKWVDLTGTHADVDEPVGATLLNDAVYGYSVQGYTLRLTLLHSSFYPDPAPELGRHTFRFALQPHVGAWTASDATRAGYAFNFPFSPIATDGHAGTLPATMSFAEVVTPNVMLSGLKKAEDSDAVIIRLYEMEGIGGTARVRLDAALAPSASPVVETDLLERPLATSSARFADGILSVHLPARGMATVMIG